MKTFTFQSAVGVALCATMGAASILGADHAAAAVTVSLSASPTASSTGSAVTFTITLEAPKLMTTTNPVYPSGPILDYYFSDYFIDFDFGDGTPLPYFASYDNQSSFEITHTYATAGVFTANFVGYASYLGSYSTIEQIATDYSACDAYDYYLDCGVPVYGPVDQYDGFNEQIAAFTQVTVTAVPEPTTYAMLLAGLGLVGTAARRRRSFFPHNRSLGR